MITCVGSVFLDRIVKIDFLPKKPIKILANNIEQRLGGSAAISSFTIKKLGFQSEFIGRFGDDEVSNFLKSEFRYFNISYNKSLFLKNTL